MDDVAMSALGIVVIGRNEGARLVRCLRSIGPDYAVVYVDSASVDASLANARDAGAVVVELDMSIPFTAARARNAGRRALGSDSMLIQFVDGDCMVDPGWLDAGQAALDADSGLAVVFGRCRELAPEASRYNWLCDVEWAKPTGPALYFGGNAMVRAAALDAVGGYPDAMIAGEEPDLAIRLRAAGWRIACLPDEMVRHDAAIYRFGQWWRRSERSGHAFAQLADRHGRSPLQDYPRRLWGVLFWGGVVPLAVLVAALAGSAIAALIVLALPALQFARLALREAGRRPPREALMLAGFLMLAKPAQAVGAVRYLLGRASRGSAPTIEHKAAA